VVQAGEHHAPVVRERAGESLEGGPDEGRPLHVAAEQQHLGGDVGEAADGAGHLGQQQPLVAQCGGELAHGDGVAGGLLVLAVHGHVGEGFRLRSRHELEGWRGQVQSVHAGDLRGRDVALGHLLVEAAHPSGVPRRVHQQGRLVGGDLADGRLGAGGLQDDQGADADPEDPLGAGPGKDRL
jgi:hypothetical protein